MRAPLSWLKEYVDITITPAELAFRLTVAGAEVSKVEYIGVAPSGKNTWGVSEDVGLVWDRDKIVVAQILEVMPHPNADRLVLADVDYGAAQPHRVGTGAPNIFHLNGQGRLADGPKVVFAREGSRLYDGHAEGQKLMTLKASKIRGVNSDAMVCSEKELGLSEEHEGIIILDQDAPVGMPLADYMGDVVLHIEILPNIARCQSVIGVAREVAALTGVPFKGTDGRRTTDDGRRTTADDKSNTEHATRNSPQSTTSNQQSTMPRHAETGYVNIQIDAPDLCPRYSAALVRDVVIGPSPEWMQRRLRMVGVRAISNIVDITNYVMMEWGQPLHAFDYDKLVQRAKATGHDIPTIIMRRAHDGEHMTTLDNVDRTLNSDMLMITDTAGPVAVAGIMGGASTEIDEHTKNVLLEAASFNYINNRKTATALKLPSEATARFGRGVPPAHTIPTARRACELMAQLAEGKVAPETADHYPGHQPPTLIHFKTSEIKWLLGMDVPIGRITSILESLDFGVAEQKPAEEDASETEERLQVWDEEGGHPPVLEVDPRPSSSNILLDISVPEHRLDVAIPADIVEEVARVIGYDQIPATLIRDELPPQRRNVSLEAEDRIRDILAGAGLYEIISYPLSTVEREALLFPDRTQADLDPTSYVTIVNPISPELRVMRHTLLPSILDTLREALRHRERVQLFELGNTYLPQAGNILPAEPARLSIALAGLREAPSWQSAKEQRLDFFDIKGVVDILTQRLNLPGVEFAPSEHPALHPARGATFRAGGETIGVFGELHPQVRENFGFASDPVCVAEFDVEALRRHMALARFSKLPRFPAVREDIAVVVNEDVPAARVEALIRDGGGAMLRSLTLFDLYRGEQLGTGKKSLAYALTYQHDERTLTDDEAARIRGRIVKKLRDELRAELRG
jgi:phenylalanyl-tRNA synthetase beta chain